MSDTVIKLCDFGAAYEKKTVLEGVSTSIRRGRITAIMGPSGCGKSTLLKAMNRMLELQGGASIRGSIHLDGQDIQSIPVDELRRRVGMVFQTPTPFPLSIYKNMTYAPLYYGVHGKQKLDEIVRENLEITGLWDEVKDELDKSALKLSGGQQQRLCIARALTAEPEILLLDEPCSALDVKSTQVIEQLLLQLKERYTIVIVTHNLFQARRIADDCIFMLGGELWEQNTTEELFSNPQRPETKDYLHGAYA
ncbi:MAG: phosphate ABC transporter ATP-binding protein [Oscillospiraceae bacterium]|nr:phosphate ABC transporter ATP-binding protein [Oscillospiraceae bacterium]